MAGGPIGFFDSGEGGLTVMREVARLLPAENLLYACDTARFPYGPRPLSEVRSFFLRFLEFFASAGCKLVVVACNTATAAALDGNGLPLPVPAVGVVEPGAAAAASLSGSGRIGVAATEATVRSAIYGRRIRAVRPDAEVLEQPCPILVIRAEEGEISGPAVRTEVVRCMEPLLSAGIDTLVLGCTHFPHMQSVIAEVCGPQVNLVDPGRETARLLAGRLKAGGLLNPGPGEGFRRFCTTGDPDRFVEVASRLWPGAVPDASRLTI
jgi:glutamate racemase